MISSPKTAQRDADVGNVQPQKLSNNARAVPLPYYGGRRVLPIIWGQSRVYNPQSRAISKKVGKSNQTTGFDQFGDLFGLVSCCLTDYFEAIEFAGEIIWAGGVSRDEDHPHHSGDIEVPTFGTFRLYWGTPDQPEDDLVLAGCGEDHPHYADQCYLVVKNCYFGSNTTSPPNIRVIVERAARLDGMPIDRSREGTNLVTALAEVISDDWFGLARPDLIDLATWSPFADTQRRNQIVPVPENPEHLAAMGFASPYLERVQAAQGFFGAILEHFDGFLRRTGTKLEIGHFPHDGIVPDGLPELTFHDFIEAPAFDADEDSDADVITDAIVSHLDRDNAMEEDTQPGPNPAARDRIGEIREKPFKRPFLVTSYQAREQANELSKFYSRPEESCTVPVRRERVVGLRAGDRFVLNDAPSELRQIVRITRRRDDSDGGRVMLSLVSERGLAPLGYVPVPQPEPELPPPDLVPIVHARVLQLPTAFADYGPAPAVAILAQRPAAHTAGFTLHFSNAGVTYDQLATVDRWALRGSLAAGISSGAATAIVNAAGFDLGLLSPQSTAAQDDDTLLLVTDYEILSIGDVTALGGGQYELALRRGRRGSSAAAHLAAATCYIIPRADLTVLEHADFPRTTTDRYFKLPTYTPDEEQDLSDALALTFTFDATGVVAPIAFAAVGRAQSIFLVWGYPFPVDRTIIATDIWERDSAAVAPVPGTDAPTWTMLANGYNRSLPAGVTKYYWAVNRDTIGSVSALVGPFSATSTAAAPEVIADLADLDAALLAEVTARIAAITAEASARLAADAAEAATRAADILAEAIARGTAITTEQTARTSADAALASSITTLTASVGTNAAAIAAETSARVSADSALASDYTTLAATVAGNTSAITTEATARASADSALTTSLSALTATVGTNTAAIASESATRASADSALSTSITTLSATVGGIGADVTTLTAAYVVGGTAIATWGFKLDGGGKVVKMQAIAASGGSQAEVGVIVFGGADLQSDTFSAGTAGWRLRPNGDVEFNDGTFRGTITIGSGTNRFHTDTSGTILGDPSSSHFKFADFAGYSTFSFLYGGTSKGFITVDSGTGAILNLQGGDLEQIGRLNAQKAHALSSANPRTLDAPLYSAGGAYINNDLDLLGLLAIGGRIEKQTSDGWTPPLFDGANPISFQWNSGQLRVLVGVTDVGGLTPV